MEHQKPCRVHKKCGGCQLQTMSYDEQLRYKQKHLQALLSPFGKVNSIIPMAHPCHYRNKVQAAFYTDARSGRILSGVYQSNSGRIVPVDACMIEDKQCSEIVLTVRKLAESFKLKPYDRKHGGFLRHVLVRRGFQTGEIMVVIISATPIFPARNNFVKALLKAHPAITTVVHNVNPNGIPLTLGDRSHILYGKGYIEDILCDKRFRISPASFYQVNPVQCEILYNTAMDFAAIKKDEAVFDAYCGTGTIGIIAAQYAGQVLGVELNRDAVRDAITNAKQNSIDNIYFINGDAGEVIVDLAKNKEHFDTVLMDPPRAGASAGFLQSLLKIKPKKIVYISCNPVTLARDLASLTKGGYRVRKIQGVDMFPYTKHVETVVLLEKE